MKKLLSMLLLVAFSASTYAGGAMSGSHSGHSMSSAKHSSGVHFYGRLYVGYDDRQAGSGAADVESLEDGGGKSRLGLKMTETLANGLQLVGHLEYKFDPVDGTQNDGQSCTSVSEATSCRTFNLHVGNLGLKTGLGYIGVGTYESPYKTMGKYDNDMDTALALNVHGGTSRGGFGQDGTMEGMLAYHAVMGPAEISYMVSVNDARSNDNTNTDQGDYALGIQLKDMFMAGLTIGYARTHDQANSGSGESNDKFFASMKVMPNAGVFVTHEDLNVVNTYKASSASNGDITTLGTHYSMGSTDLQIAYAKGDSDGAATEDYKTLGISARMNLSKTSDITFGYIKQDFDSTGTDITTRGIGLTHKF